MKSRLIDQVATGVAWSTAEKVCSMLLQMVVSIVVARLLVPEDFGVMAILTFFTAVALVVVDSGFSQTLLRKATPTDDDYKSVFTFNLVVSVVLYLLFVAVSPLLARYYNLQIITKISPVLFLLLPINALGIIQNTKLSREFRFGVLSRINFAASLVAGVVAIVVALLLGVFVDYIKNYINHFITFLMNYLIILIFRNFCSNLLKCCHTSLSLSGSFSK